MNIYLKLRIGLNCVELLACITGFIYWNKFKSSYWKCFPIYLAIIIATELTAEYIGNVMNNQELTADIYRFFGIPVQFVFFYWIFYKWFEQSRGKKWILGGSSLYLLVLAADILVFSKVEFWFSSLSYLIGNIILLLFIIVFFLRFINSESILNYKESMMFWISTGLLVFYLGSLPFYGLWNTLRFNYPDIFNKYWMIQVCLDYMMYLFFVISFIWGKVK